MPKFNSSPKTSSDSKNYLKLKDRDSVTGIFRGDVREFYVQWIDKKPIECDENAAGAKFRFCVNLVFKDKETNQLVAKIFEQGAVVYNQIKDLNSEYDLETTFVKITRNGSGMNDTNYSILPILKQTVTEQIEKQLSAVELHELAPKSQETHEQDGASGFDADEEIPL